MAETDAMPQPQQRIPRRAMRSIKRQVFWKDGSPANRCALVASQTRRAALREYRKLDAAIRARLRFPDWLREKGYGRGPKIVKRGLLRGKARRAQRRAERAA